MRTRPQSITFNYLLISNRNEVKFRAQLLEGRLALNPGLNFNPGFFLFCSKAFPENFLYSFQSIGPTIKIVHRRMKLNWLVKCSYLNSNFTLTLGYLYPVLTTRPWKEQTWKSKFVRSLSVHQPKKLQLAYKFKLICIVSFL